MAPDSSLSPLVTGQLKLAACLFGSQPQFSPQVLGFSTLQVFMESNKAPDGSLSPLAARNIDTGMGLERMAQILQARPHQRLHSILYRY